MAGKIVPSGNYGYKAAGLITIPLGGAAVTVTITPADADLHDISKEGILVTHAIFNKKSGSQGAQQHLALFNKTTLNDPITNYNTANWKTVIADVVTGAAYGYRSDSFIHDLTSLPGGGVPLVADFVTLTGKLGAAVAADCIFEYFLYYQWININSDDYRTLLYARSV